MNLKLCRYVFFKPLDMAGVALAMNDPPAKVKNPPEQLLDNVLRVEFNSTADAIKKVKVKAESSLSEGQFK